MISAAMTPGTQPQSVSRNTINNEPHPWSITAKGGNRIANKALNSDITYAISNTISISNTLSVSALYCAYG